MIKELLVHEGLSFNWLDIVAPEEEELLEASLMFELPMKSVRDCLDPDHLPKYEEYGFTTFVVTRCYDDDAPSDASTIQQLTRKVAIFINEDYLISIHRKNENFLADIRSKIQIKQQNDGIVLVLSSSFGDNVVFNDVLQMKYDILVEILKKVIFSYEIPLEQFEETFESLEDKIFKQKMSTTVISDIYVLKRRMTVCRRMLRQTIDAMRKIEKGAQSTQIKLNYLLADGERLLFRADAAIDNLHNLLNLYMTLQSNRTNETMRFLTVFSAFFLPLTFIVGLYGMNFENMPELKQPYGYYFVLFFMFIIIIIIYIWFKNKKWI